MTSRKIVTRSFLHVLTNVCTRRNVSLMETTQKLTRWTAETDYRDATTKSGYARTTFATRVTRDEAETALRSAVTAHVAKTGHVVAVSQSYPGKTFVSCSCKQAFVATAVR